MTIETTTSAYEYKLKKAGLTEPLTTYLADPADPDRLAAGFPAVVSVDGVNELQGPSGTLLRVSPSGGIPLSVNRTITAADDGKVFACTTALTVTFPAALSPRPAVVFMLPPTGNVSIAVSGGATLNGATSTINRARSSNPAGVVVQPYQETDGYGVSGS